MFYKVSLGMIVCLVSCVQTNSLRQKSPIRHLIGSKQHNPHLSAVPFEVRENRVVSITIQNESSEYVAELEKIDPLLIVHPTSHCKKGVLLQPRQDQVNRYCRLDVFMESSRVQFSVYFKVNNIHYKWDFDLP